jgi:protease-4
VLRIDSPGGSGFASDLIWREVQLTANQKPVVVSMSDVAASGGYYIAMGANHIVTQPATLTGSIGVIAGKMVLNDFYDWAGMNIESIKRGENADLFTASQGFDEKQRKILGGYIEDFYDTFVHKAAEGREMTWEEMHELAQGRVWTGEQAVETGLADELGGLTEAIAQAKNLSGLPLTEPVPLDVYPKRKTFFEMLSQMDQTQVLEGKMPRSVRRIVDEAATLKILEDEPLLTLMPFRVVIK